MQAAETHKVAVITGSTSGIGEAIYFQPSGKNLLTRCLSQMISYVQSK